MLLFYFFGCYAGDLTEALKLNDEAIQMYQNFAKHWMMRGQIFEQQNQMDNARDAYKQGVYPHIVYFFNLFHYMCVYLYNTMHSIVCTCILLHGYTVL